MGVEIRDVNSERRDMSSNDFITLFFLVAAVLIFFQLRSVLGRRTGNEKPPRDLYTPRDAVQNDSADAGKVVTLPRRDVNGEEEDRFSAIDAFAPAGTPLNESLRALNRADASFDPKEFLNGARMAYEMIVMAFADGDRKTLKNLLSREVYDGFDAAITEREKRGETSETRFVSIDTAEIIGAEMRGKSAQVTLRFVSKLISATRDRTGAVIDGNPEKVTEVTDVWTFARDISSRDPNWKLIATEAGH